MLTILCIPSCMGRSTALLVLVSTSIFLFCGRAWTEDEIGNRLERDQNRMRYENLSVSENPNFCSVTPPNATQFTSCLDTVFFLLLEHKPDASRSMIEIEVAEKYLERFDCLNENVVEDQMLLNIQVQLWRAALLVGKMKYNEAQYYIAKVRNKFDRYFMAVNRRS